MHAERDRDRARRAAREHYPVLVSGKPIGEIASGTFSPTLQKPIAMAYVPPRFAELGTEPVAENRATPAALGAHLKAEIDKWSPIIKKAGVYAD